MIYQGSEILLFTELLQFLFCWPLSTCQHAKAIYLLPSQTTSINHKWLIVKESVELFLLFKIFHEHEHNHYTVAYANQDPIKHCVFLVKKVKMAVILAANSGMTKCHLPYEITHLPPPPRHK